MNGTTGSSVTSSSPTSSSVRCRRTTNGWPSGCSTSFAPLPTAVNMQSPSP